MAQKGNIGVTTENIFPVIKKFLYSDHDIFLREMVSNAVDATQKLKTLAAQGDFKGEIGDTTVRVSLDEKAGTLTISDRGIGMTEEEIDKYINQIAFSGVTDFLDKYKENAMVHRLSKSRMQTRQSVVLTLFSILQTTARNSSRRTRSRNS